MSVFMTPDLKPVAGGTYFPPHDQWGRPGFKSILLTLLKQVIPLRLMCVFCLQATSGGGGWPMSVWLTPDLRPVFGGTYYPPDDRYFGQPGFKSLLNALTKQVS